MEETKQIQKTPNPYLIPLAIVIAGAFVAVAIYISGVSSGKARVVGNGDDRAQQVQDTGSLDNVREITANDHVMGDPNALIKIVEYSDFECPFCKSFHNTLNRIMDEYGKSGEVAWVYRHFPLDQLHPVKARAEAVASECVTELGGNDAFWQFTNRFMELTPSNNQTEIDIVIPQIVRELGLDEVAFQECFESGRYDDNIEADIANAVETGGRGTPWSILIAPNGEKFPINGAQPYEAVKQLIELVKTEQ